MKIPTIYQLKPAFQNFLRPLARFLVKIGVTANQITILAVLISIATGFIIYHYREISSIYLLLPSVFFIRMALNAIDGMLAREFNMQSKLGAILNELGDVLSDSALYLPFAFIFTQESSLLIFLITLLAVISEMTGVIAIQIGASRRYDGPMGKSDRAFVFGTIAFLMGCGFYESSWFSEYLSYLLMLIVFLLLLTILNRIGKALAEVK